MKTWILERMGEKSTWAGLSILLGSCGVYVDSATMTTIGMGVAGMLGALHKEG